MVSDRGMAMATTSGGTKAQGKEDDQGHQEHSLEQVVHKTIDPFFTVSGWL